jgi:uncharacterized protein YrzB (UPF0473 family)
MEERKIFKVKNEEGIEIECEVLFTFDSEETNKSYMAYTDNTKDEEGSVKVYAAVYEEDGANFNLKPITTEKEWKIVETILEEVQAEFEESNEQ